MKNKFLKSLVLATIILGSITSTTFASTTGGWVQNLTGNYSYFETGSNTPVIGFKQIGGQWYYFSDMGIMRTGWIDKAIGFDNQWFYFDTNGAMHTGWLLFNNNWYYFGTDGVMDIGFINDNGTWYFTNSNGIMQKGVIEIDDSIYMFAPNMQKGLALINGETYTFGDDGKATGKLPTPIKSFTHYGVEVNVVMPNQNTNYPSDTVVNPTSPVGQVTTPPAVTPSNTNAVSPISNAQPEVKDKGNSYNNNTIDSNNHTNSDNTVNSNNTTTVTNNYYGQNYQVNN